MPFGKIDELLRRGEIAIWHRYDQGTFYDFSGNGNEPDLISNVTFEQGGIRFNDSNGYIRVADSAELQINLQMSVIVNAKFPETDRTGAGSGARLISKRDGTGNNYEFITSDTGGTQGIYVYTGGTVADKFVQYTGSRTVGFTCYDDVAPVGYVDGLSIGDLDAAVDLTSDDAPLFIGNWYSATRSTYCVMYGFMIVRRILTETEMAQVHGELEGLRRK